MFQPIILALRHLGKVLTAGMLVALTGCGSGGDAGVGGVSPSEARALNEAATMLDNSAAPALSNTIKAP
ncbi:hypothetical protein BH10PSE12_BH10PSE12_10850 [soil metagenome]